MEGAPNFEQQPTGPFAWRNRFNELVKFCRALALAEDKNGGKIIYGENKVTFDIGFGEGNSIPTLDVVEIIDSTPTWVRYTFVPAKFRTVLS